MIYSVSTLNLTGLKESFEEMGFRFKQDREGFVDLEMYMNALRVAFREVEMGPAERDSVRVSLVSWPRCLGRGNLLSLLEA